MAKRNNRASRRLQREKAARAEVRGLPQPKPQPSRGAAPPSLSRGFRPGSGGRSATTSSGQGTAWKLALGVVVALAIVFAISQSRKEELMVAPAVETPGDPAVSTIVDGQSSPDEVEPPSETVAEADENVVASSEALGEDEPSREEQVLEGSEQESHDETQRATLEVSKEPLGPSTAHSDELGPATRARPTATSSAMKETAAPAPPQVRSQTTVRGPTPPTSPTASDERTVSGPTLPKRPVEPTVSTPTVTAPKVPTSDSAEATADSSKPATQEK